MLDELKQHAVSDNALENVGGGGLGGSVVGALGEATGTIAGALVTAGGKIVKATDDFLKPVIRWIL
ncbi:MAG: hypothetical protein RL385_2802 [Pseudomonadota bacterium]|jgi:hypothetical protein